MEDKHASHPLGNTTTRKFDEHISVWAALFDNVKTTTLGMAIIIVVILFIGSNDGIHFITSTYESITGKKVEVFTPLTNTGHASFQALEKSLTQNGIKVTTTSIEVFKSSDTDFKYKIKARRHKATYNVFQDTNREWKINKIR